MDAAILMGVLAPFQNRREMLSAEQSTGDIIDAILDAHRRHAQDYSKISSFFNAGSKMQTARKIYNFLKKNVRYVIEPGSKQTVKSPAAILATGYGDCKHYSLFAGGILQNLGIPFAYRFASYRIFDKQPQHVFVVVNPGTENEIWIDPVVGEFNYKKPYTYAIDKKMALYSISGIGATAQQKADLRAAKAARKAAPTKAAKQAAATSVKAARKAAGRTTGQVLKKGAKVVLKVAAAPVRNAFLLLVSLNFAGLGNKLAAAWEKAPSKLQNFWESAGGQINALKKAWEKGSTKKRIFGMEQIGVAPAAPAAAAVTAAPLLVKVADFLQKIGIDPAELVQVGRDAINKKSQELAKKVLEPKAATDAEFIDVADQVFEQPAEMAPTTTTTATKKPNFLPLILGGAAVLYFVTRKK
jgi:Transglutaminase-like superfamily